MKKKNNNYYIVCVSKALPPRMIDYFLSKTLIPRNKLYFCRYKDSKRLFQIFRKINNSELNNNNIFNNYKYKIFVKKQDARFHKFKSELIPISEWPKFKNEL